MIVEHSAQLEETRPGRPPLFVRKVQLGVVSKGDVVRPKEDHAHAWQLLCVHGTSASEQQYSRLLSCLDGLLQKHHEWMNRENEESKASPAAVTWHAILYDWMGCGQSPAAADDEGHAYSNEQVQEDLKAVMDQHIDRKNPLVLICHSYACNIVLPLLLEQQQQRDSSHQIKAVILLSSGVRDPHNPNADGGHFVMKLPLPLLNCLQGQLTEAFVQRGVHADHVELRDEIREASNQNSMRVAQAYQRQQSWTSLEVVEATLKDKVPVLLVHGAEDEIIPVESAQAMHRVLSDASSDNNAAAELIVLEGARHLVMLELPYETARVIWDFLSQLISTTS